MLENCPVLEVSSHYKVAGASVLASRLAGTLRSGVCAIAFVLTFTLLHAYPASAETYTVGIVPQFEARRLHEAWHPMLDALSERAGVQFEILGNSSIPEFEASVNAGEFDLIYSNPWHAVIAHERQGYEPIVRDGARMLTGILVVSKDSNITDVSQLAGAEVAFPSPNALGASLLMRADLTRIFGIDYTPIYVDTHPSVYLNVILGTTAAGGGVMRTLTEQSDKIFSKLRVLYETRPMPPHPISVHPRVPVDIRERIKKALIELGAAAETNPLFADIPMKKPIATEFEEYSMLEGWGLREFYVTQ